MYPFHFHMACVCDAREQHSISLKTTTEIDGINIFRLLSKLNGNLLHNIIERNS